MLIQLDSRKTPEPLEFESQIRNVQPNVRRNAIRDCKMPTLCLQNDISHHRACLNQLGFATRQLTQPPRINHHVVVLPDQIWCARNGHE